MHARDDILPSITSELEEMGLNPPDFGNSNFSLMDEFAKNKGKHVNKEKKKVMLLVDGLGYDTVEKAVARDEKISKFIERNTLEKMSTVFPSFTPSVIISLNSGLEVGQHGIIGNFFFKGYGAMINPFKISWLPSKNEVDGVAPEIMPRPANLEKIKKRGGFVYAMRDEVLRKETNSDFLSDCEVLPHTGNEDLFVGIERLLRRKNCDFIYAYTDALDHFSHSYSKTSEETVRLTARLFRDIMELEEKLKEANAELFVFSDHGQVVFKDSDIERIGWKDKFLDFLEMPVFGNSRSFYMKIIDGKEKAFEDYFEKKYSKKAALFDTNELIKAGIFGKKKLPEFARFNLGDKTAITKDNAYFSFAKYGEENHTNKNKYNSENIGTHGGMSHEEMEIPLLKVG